MGISFDVASLEAQIAEDKKGVGGSSITPTPNPQVAGVDGLGAALWVHWRKLDFELFEQLLQTTQDKARASNKSEFFSWHGCLIEVSPYGTRDGGGFPYRFIIDGIFFACGRKHEAGSRHNMQVTMLGQCMMQQGWNPRSAWDHVHSVLRKIGVAYVEKNTCSRLDPFADCPGVHVKQFRQLARRGGFICRARWFGSFSGIDQEEIRASVERSFAHGFEAVVADLRNLWGKVSREALTAALVEASQGAFTFAEYGKTSEDMGWQFGRGGLVGRIYNKVLECEKFHPERLQPMRDAWGVDDKTPVTRIEFQLRGPALRSFGIRTVEDAIEKLGSVAQYCVNEWLVGVSAYDGKNKDRREVARIWKRVQGFFTVGFRDRSPIKRVKPEPKNNGTTLNRMALAFAVSGAGRNCGPCESADDVRATVIDQLDEAARDAGGWPVLLSKQVKAASRFSNSLGLPLAARSNSRIRSLLLDQCFDEARLS